MNLALQIVRKERLEIVIWFLSRVGSDSSGQLVRTRFQLVQAA